MTINDAQAKNAKPQAKAYKLNDERGLVLLINPNGAKWWRFRYTFHGREKMLSLGVYPDVTLKRAREKRDEARRMLADGEDPSAIRKTERAELVNTFEGVAREWFKKRESKWVPSHASKVIARLENDVFPYIGRHPISKLEAPHILDVLRRVEKRGAVETAHRIKQSCSSIFKYAIADGHAKHNVCADLDLVQLMPKPKVINHASITEPAKIGALLRAIDGYDGSPEVRAALQLAPLVFVRPGELRAAEWAEIDTEKREWRIPAERMKMNELHIVPLSKQALAVLESIRPLTGRSRFVFPGARTSRNAHTARPLSDNALNAALRRMGYEQGTMTAHGFRSMASTLLNEQGFNGDWIERQLAHGERDPVRKAYNYAQYLPERRKMMQAWADYLDTLREGNVVSIGKRRA